MIGTVLAMDPLTLWSFAAAGIVLNLTPGADVMFTLACGMQGGPRAGLAAAAGIAAGAACHVALAVLGLAALLQALPGALTAVRWGGAAYLLWLAWASWTARGAQAAQGAQSLMRAFRRGMLTNLLNPKVGLFILAFLPQFADPALGPVAPQMAVLGAIFLFTGLIITGGYGAMAGVMGRALRARQRLLQRLSALVFGGLALRLVLD